MKILSYEVANKWVYLGGLVLIGLFVFIFLSIPSCQKPNTPQQAINEVKAELEKQYTKTLTEKDGEIKNYKDRLTLSEGKYKVLVSKYDDLKRRKDEIKPPITNAETRTRFSTAGFTPLPVK